MKFVAGLVVVVAVAAAIFVGVSGQQGPTLPPDMPMEEAISGLATAITINNAARIPALIAIGHIGHSLQPSPFSSAPTFDDPSAKQRWDERMAVDRERRERLFGLLNATSAQLTQLAATPDASTSRRAIWALGGIRATSPESKSLLEAIALDGARSSLDRQAAIIALSRVDPAEARLVITTILAQGNVDAVLLSASVSGLRLMGADAVPQLRALLASPDPLQRGYAINGLGALRGDAAAAAGDIAAAIAPDLPFRLQRAAVRSLIAIAPDDVRTFERVVTTTAFDRAACNIAGQHLGTRPGAVAFEFQRCSAHQPEPKAATTTTPEAVQRALIAAAGGGTNAVVSRFAEGRQYGDVYGEATERVIVACVEPRGTHDSLRQLARAETAAAPAPNELRMAAVRVAGDDVILDSIGGLVDTDTPAASCEEISVDHVIDPGRWPLAQIKFTTAQPATTASTHVEWMGVIDPSTRLWRMRVPIQLYHLRADGTIFSDQLMNELSEQREFRVIAAWSGIDAVVAAQRPSIAVRYASMFSNMTSALPNLVVPSAPLTQARWTRVVMYPVNMSGVPRAKPVIPDGIPVSSMAGALILPHPPADPRIKDLPRAKLEFWRKYLKHDHLTVRIMAAGELAKLKDRGSLADIVGILNSSGNPRLQLEGVLDGFGPDVLPYLEPLTRSLRTTIRQTAWRAIAKTGAAGAPLFKQALGAGTNVQRHEAVKALHDLHKPPVADLVPSLVKLIDVCDSPQWPMGCFELLGLIRLAGEGAAAAQPALEQRVEKTTGFARLMTADALRAVGGRDRANAVIVEMARTGRDSDAENALRRLDVKAGDLAIYIEVLQRREASTASSFAAQQIGTLAPGPEAAWAAVLSMSRDADPAVRRRVLPAFTGYRTSEATTQLGVLMRDPDGEVRRAAFTLLKDRGLGAVPLLAPAFDEPNNIRHELFALLGKLGPPVLTTAPAMVARLEQVAKGDPDKLIQMSAARAVAAIRGTK